VVLPYIVVSASNELFLRDNLLLQFLLFFVLLYFLQITVVWRGHILVFSEQATPIQIDHFTLWRLERKVGVLFVAHGFGDGVGQDVGWQVAQGGVVTDAEALLDRVLFLVCEVVEKLGEVGQLVVLD
jgi:hypothetical protein